MSVTRHTSHVTRHSAHYNIQNIFRRRGLNYYQVTLGLLPYYLPLTDVSFQKLQSLTAKCSVWNKHCSAATRWSKVNLPTLRTEEFEEGRIWLIKVCSYYCGTWLGWPLYQEHCLACHQGSKFLVFCANLAAGELSALSVRVSRYHQTENWRLKSFPAQFGSLLICSFMVSPGQSQHEHTALLYLTGEVSVL